ncbi:MAG: lipid IV(A) 3-deoxy-D-manno-octulosonic acid transferase [Betaproteobacteria bacterium]
MSAWRGLYTAVLYLLTPFALMRLWWRGRKQPGYRLHIPERFGYYAMPAQQPLLWLHTVSVGETLAATPLIDALRIRWPEHRILLTHMTPTGRETGERVFGDEVLRCYLPYDLPAAVARFLAHFRPSLGVLLETEIWPNLIHACHLQQVPLYLVNARMSERSARGYRRVRDFAAQTLGELAGIAAQTQADAGRLTALGARGVQVIGNLKFDRGPSPIDLELCARFRAALGNRPVFLAASTREGEEEKVLRAVELAAHPGLLTVIVPRHPQRFEAVAQLMTARGIAFQRRSSNAPVAPITQVWLGDSLGELFAFYAACDVAFVGGSLLPLGGQNLLEPCALGKPVLIGPSSFNFADATRWAVDGGAALQVRDEVELGRALAELLDDPPSARRMGEAGLALMRAHRGAAQRVVELLEKSLDSVTTQSIG